MRYKYAFLDSTNVVVKLLDTPNIVNDDNVVNIESLDGSLLGSTYNKETNEFVKVLESEE